jgi:hypothetical protein
VRLSLALLLVLTLALPATAGAAAKRHGKCAMKGSKTLAADARGRVFEKLNRDGEFLYGCLYRTGRRFPLGENPHDDEVSIDILALTSPYVAYGETDRTPYGSTEFLARIDLRNGREKDVGDGFSTLNADGPIEELLVTRGGALAWTYTGLSDPPALTVEKLDADGRSVLDPGPGVDHGSLAATPGGHRVYWSNGGQPRSAPLR